MILYVFDEEWLLLSFKTQWTFQAHSFNICFSLLCPDSHNDVPPEAQRYVTIAALQGAVRPSSSIKVADIIRLFFLDYTTPMAG